MRKVDCVVLWVAGILLSAGSGCGTTGTTGMTVVSCDFALVVVSNRTGDEVTVLLDGAEAGSTFQTDLNLVFNMAEGGAHTLAIQGTTGDEQLHKFELTRGEALGLRLEGQGSSITIQENQDVCTPAG